MDFSRKAPGFNFPLSVPNCRRHLNDTISRYLPGQPARGALINYQWTGKAVFSYPFSPFCPTPAAFCCRSRKRPLFALDGFIFEVSRGLLGSI